MNKLKRAFAILLAGVMSISVLAGCNSNETIENNNSDVQKMGEELIQETKDMTEEEYLNFAGQYALDAREIVPFQIVNDAKLSQLSEGAIINVFQFEWVNTIYNISKYQSLLSTYSHALSFNDDGTLNYEETTKSVTDGVFQAMYKGMTDNGLQVLWKNDSVYVTTDVIAFRDRVKDYVDEPFVDYIDIVAHTDAAEFIKDGKINYDEILGCMIFEEDFLRNHQTNELWETIYQQFYAQMMMYTGLYGTGGFFNDDGSYNSDFETRFKNDIEANYGTYFAAVGAAIIDQLSTSNKDELDTTSMNTIVSYCLDNEFADEMVQFMDLYGSEDEQGSTVGDISGEDFVTIIDDGTSTSPETPSETETETSENVAEISE